MTSVPPPFERVQRFIELAEEFVREQALGVLSKGYAGLVASVHANKQLREIALHEGIDAVLKSTDSAIVELRNKARSEFATPAERGAEQAMGDRVLQTFPDDAVLGEELGARGKTSQDGGSGIRWVFDPVDGTTSMLRTAVAQAYSIELPDPEPAFGVTIGVVSDDKAVAGVVAELRPRQDDGLKVDRLWAGGSGVPTTCNGTSVIARPAVPLAEATLTCTAPWVMFGKSEEQWGTFQALEEAAARVITGQNCIGFMELLGRDGRFNIAFEQDLTLPDIAAIGPILLNAGVAVTDIQGNPLLFGPEQQRRGHEFSVLAAHPTLYRQAAAQIRSGPNGRSTREAWGKKETGVDVRKFDKGPEV